ncbi:transposase [Streptomyces tateyamensis]|uniref:transposase n=1 Tax=Streptomyces tateyamensis TaxID=565073 RepID=UPI0015E8785F|nr:transposase [Streptomyces tateyamensis]
MDALEHLTACYEEISLLDGVGHPARAAGEPRHRRSKAANLLDRLDIERDQVLRFTFDWRVPLDNSTSEQAIRMARHQKIPGCSCCAALIVKRGRQVLRCGTRRMGHTVTRGRRRGDHRGVEGTLPWRRH